MEKDCAAVPITGARLERVPPSFSNTPPNPEAKLCTAGATSLIIRVKADPIAVIPCISFGLVSAEPSVSITAPPKEPNTDTICPSCRPTPLAFKIRPPSASVTADAPSCTPRKKSIEFFANTGLETVL